MSRLAIYRSKMARVIVTGGAGFIGSHIVDALVMQHHTVTVVDDLSSGKQENVPAGVELVRQDIRSPRMKDVWRDFRPQFVFHLAAQKNIRTSIDDPLYDADVNIAGSLNIIEQSRRFGVKKIIFSSSAAVYGEVRRVPISEKIPTQPVSPYGIAKASIEQYLQHYRVHYRLNSVALRYANVYGPRQDADGEAGVVAIFTQKILGHQPLLINGHGRQTRDYVFVGDVVRANLLAMKSSTATGNMNISTGRQTSVNSLARALQKVAKVKTRIKHRSALPGEVMRNALHYGLAKKKLSWKPEVKLRDGLLVTWEWAKGSL